MDLFTVSCPALTLFLLTVLLLIEYRTKHEQTVKRNGDKTMKQVAADLSAAMVMAGFVTMMTVWMMVLAA